MNTLDYTVTFLILFLIVLYGYIKTRRKNENISDYLKGDDKIQWSVIGLSVMATQASAITFISTPALGYTKGMDYIQNYLGLPLALLVVVAFIIPIYQKLKVYTAYEYLEQRFDLKTRLLTALLFLAVRGLSAGMTIFAPTIILASMLGWSISITAIIIGVFVTVYTVFGGTQGVSVTQKYQMLVMLLGIGFIFLYCIYQFPEYLSFNDSLVIAGKMGHLNAIDLSFDIRNRYNLWNGVLAGFFLSLSYFGTDQSQVQRYLVGGNTTKSRLGLVFNAIFKIPMQFVILLTGVMVFVFYQFTAPNINFRINNAKTPNIEEVTKKYNEVYLQKKELLKAWTISKKEETLDKAVALQTQMEGLKKEYNTVLIDDGIIKDKAAGEDKNFVFISFILAHIPHGFIGLLIAMVLAAAMSSSAAELNALGTTSMVDFLNRLHPNSKEWTDRKKVLLSKSLTVFWGIFTIIIALNGNLVENLIEAINIIGSLFYGVILGVFLVGFFFKKIGAQEVFYAALVMQMLVFASYYLYGDEIAYLWYNMSALGVIGIALFLAACKRTRQT